MINKLDFSLDGFITIDKEGGDIMFKIFKREPEPEPKRYYFKKSDIPKFYKYYDEVNNNNTYLNKYYLWEFIYKTLNINPDTYFKIDINNITRPYIVEMTK